jgi:GTP cyclohydrolase II
MTFFSVEETSSNRVSRALNDLRRGVPVIINKNYLIASVETLTESNFNKLTRAFKDKLTLAMPSHKGYVVRNASDLCFEALKSFCEPGAAQPNTTAEQHYQLMRRILTLAKLLPIALLLPLTPQDEPWLKDFLNLDESDLASYERNLNLDIEQITTTVPIPLKGSQEASMTIFRVPITGEEHYAITIRKLQQGVDPLVRLHSSCYTGDLLQSLRCDCHSQLLAAIQIMSQSPESAGIIVYLAQEGRGIGLANKLRAYCLQDKGYDTVEANERLGFEMDARDYSLAAEILKKLNITRVRLLTNNPSKTSALIERGIAISQTLPLMTEINRYNENYMETKRKKMAHTI